MKHFLVWWKPKQPRMAKVIPLHHKYLICLKSGQISVHSWSEKEQDHPSEQLCQVAATPLQRSWKQKWEDTGISRSNTAVNAPREKRQRRRVSKEKRVKEEKDTKHCLSGWAVERLSKNDTSRQILVDYNATGTILPPDVKTSFWLKDNAYLRESGV